MIMKPWKDSGSGKRDTGRISSKDDRIISGTTNFFLLSLFIDKAFFQQCAVCRGPGTLPAGMYYLVVETRTVANLSAIVCRRSRSPHQPGKIDPSTNTLNNRTFFGHLTTNCPWIQSPWPIWTKVTCFISF